MTLQANYSYPTAIKFGAGRIAELAESCLAVGMHSPLLVTDRGLANLPITQNALNLLTETLPNSRLFAEVDPNPTEENLTAAIAVYKAGNHDGVVAFGGGSGLDLGKCVAFMAGQTRPVWDFEDIGDYWQRANADVIAPIIAVPTTAGTGSEVGRASIITNAQSHEKKIIFHPKILPAIVIADPELTVGMPKTITAGTGMDAFAHCLEAFCSPHYHPMSQGIALEGMKLVQENLLQAYHNPNDITARSHMMSAAMMGATAFQKGLGAIHALSHPIGAIFGTHHGTTNAVVMAAVLDYNREYVAEPLAQAAAYMGIKGGFDGFTAFVDDLNNALSIPKNLTELGLHNPDITRIVADALADPSAGGNPRPMTTENTENLLRSLF